MGEELLARLTELLPELGLVRFLSLSDPTTSSRPSVLRLSDAPSSSSLDARRSLSARSLASPSSKETNAEMRADGRLKLDGVNVKYMPAHGPLSVWCKTQAELAGLWLGRLSWGFNYLFGLCHLVTK